MAGLAIASVTLIGADGASDFRDLNHNGQLDPYENPRLAPEARAEDLLARMTLAEKAGEMMHGSLRNGEGESPTGYDMAYVKTMVADRHVDSLVTRLSVSPRELAAANNAVQRVAEATRLGIPVLISTDPRNHFEAVQGASVSVNGFSQWPETLGFAALDDPALVEHFGDIARREYRAVGIQMALSPQADLASEPRWSRINGTFGTDPAKVSELAGAYVRGFQHGSDGVASDGVATVVKHWVGYGAEPEGFDGHNYYGRFVTLDNASFALHVAAFKGAFAAHAVGVMPMYPILRGVTIDGQKPEGTGAGYSKLLLQKLLRHDMGYGGLIISDWAITNDCPEACRAPTAQQPQTVRAIATSWGVEDLTPEQRFAKGVEAGIDQFGGADDPAPLIAAVHDGLVPVSALDAAVRRVLLLKFRLGLFDDPYVDPAAAEHIVANPQAHALADATQRAAMVLLKKGPLLSSGNKVWLSGVDADAARAAGLIAVDDPRSADIALVRTATPHELLHPNHFFGSRQHEGRLDFRPGDTGYDAVMAATEAGLPVVLAVDMDRPAVLSALNDKVAGLLAVFGASDAALLDIVTGRATPKGRLPFDLPSSMAAVRAQNPALPNDGADPLYREGAGIVR